VDRSGGPDACWPWTGGMNADGYGLFYLRGKTFASHRQAWRLTHGEIPPGMCICHNCPGGDRRECQNPRHMWLGTNVENMADMAIKGRTLRKLTVDDVRVIRDAWARREATTLDLGRRFEVTASTIKAVVTRRTWKHV